MLILISLLIIQLLFIKKLRVIIILHMSIIPLDNKIIIQSLITNQLFNQVINIHLELNPIIIKL